MGDPSDAIDEMGAKASSPDMEGCTGERHRRQPFRRGGSDKRGQGQAKAACGSAKQVLLHEGIGKDKKNLFGVIVCQKKSAYVSFRVDPDAFGHDESPEIRSGYRWFFTKEAERRINLTKPNFELILRCLEHAQDVTVKL